METLWRDPPLSKKVSLFSQLFVLVSALFVTLCVFSRGVRERSEQRATRRTAEGLPVTRPDLL